MSTNAEFHEKLKSTRARFHLCDLHVHTPDSEDYDSNGKSLTPSEFLNCLEERRDLLASENGLSEGEDWGIIAATDHNAAKYAVDLSKEAWQKRNQKRLVVLPGIELDVSFNAEDVEGTVAAHILCVFAPCTEERHVLSAIRESSESQWDVGKGLDLGQSSLASFVYRVRHHSSYPAICIAAHIDTGKGVREQAKREMLKQEVEYARLSAAIETLRAEPQAKGSEYPPTLELSQLSKQKKEMETELLSSEHFQLALLRFIGSCGFDALQVSRKAAGRHFRRLHRFSQEQGRAVAIVCSDAHKIESIFNCEAGEIPYLKLASLANALSMQEIFHEIRDRGLRFGETRFLCSLPGQVTTWISGVEITPDAEHAKRFWPFPECDSAKERASFVLPLSRNLNCLIGGRGSGKSSVIEALAFVAQPEAFVEQAGVPEARRTDWYKRAKATLGGCGVRICWTTLEKGFAHLPKKAVFVYRYFDMGDKHDLPLYFGLDGALLPAARGFDVEIFRLHRIEELVGKPEELREFFDSLCGPEAQLLNDEIASLTQELEKQRSDILRIAQGLSKLTAEGAPLRTYTERKLQYEAVDAEQVRRKYERLDHAEKASDIATRSKDKWTAIVAEIGLNRRKTSVERFFEELAKATVDDQGHVLQFCEPLRRIVDKDAHCEGSIYTKLQKALDELGSQVSAVSQVLAQIANEVLMVATKERESIEKEGLPAGAHEREAKKKAFDEAQVAFEQYLQLLDSWKNRMKERQDIFSKLEEACRKRTVLRRRKAEEITRELGAELDPNKLVIEVDAQPMGDKRKLEEWMRTNFFPPGTKYVKEKLAALVQDNQLMPEQLRDFLLGEGSLNGTSRDSASTGRVTSDDLLSYREHSQGRCRIPPEKGEPEVPAASWAALPAEIRDGLWEFRVPPDARDLSTSELSSVLQLDEILFDDLPEIRLKDRPGEMEHARPVQELSPGQRCSAILPILLLNGRAPLIIDQPEDNLDNRLIRDVVVNILASIKLKRQVIVATHNPNLPVLGDVEQCMILRAVGQDKCDLQAMGDLDSQETVMGITEVMEGGREAFQFRQSVYQGYWRGPVHDAPEPSGG